MTAMTTILWLTAVVILSCVLFQRLSGKVGVPALLFFILLGMFFGTDGVVKISFDNFELAQNVCSVALLFMRTAAGWISPYAGSTPAIGSSRIYSVLPVSRRASSVASFTRCASPPESVVEDCPSFI